MVDSAQSLHVVINNAASTVCTNAWIAETYFDRLYCETYSEDNFVQCGVESGLFKSFIIAHQVYENLSGMFKKNCFFIIIIIYWQDFQIVPTNILTFST